MAKAVLASASSLEFAAEGASPQIITVYSDAQWVADVPDWITIDPETGSGTTEVTVSVTDNLRDGEIDNPRTADLVFRGNTLDSRDVVVVTQTGDKYRDVGDYTVTEAVNAAVGTVVIMPEAQVMAVTTTGLVISDGNANLYMSYSETEVSVGDIISFKAERSQVSGLPAVSTIEDFEITGSSTVTYPDATDITDMVDTYTSDVIEYVTVTGALYGTVVSFEDATYSVNIQDAPDSFGLSLLNGHLVTVTGYFAGVSSPYVNLILTAVSDEGLYENVYFSDDFSWLKEYVDACEEMGYTVSSSVEDKDTGSTGARNIYTFSILTSMDLLEALRARGYVDLNPDEQTIYLQKYYFKFGKTNSQSGLTLPPFDESFPAEADIIVSFQWCTHVGSTGKPDSATELVVEIVEGDGKIESSQDVEGKISTVFTTTQEENANDPQFFWMDASVRINGATPNTRISIHPDFMEGQQGGSSTYMRYYLDNIKIVPAE